MLLELVFALLFIAILTIMAFAIFGRMWFGVSQAPAASAPAPAPEVAPAPTPEPPPPQTVIHEEVVKHSIDWQSVLPIIFAVAAVVFVALVVVWAFKFFKVRQRLEDIRDDKNKAGEYALNLPGACGSCGLKLDLVVTLLKTNPLHFCVLHDNRRKMVQRVLFNPKGEFPYTMVFDYNSNYTGNSPYDFSGCSYLVLSRRERKKLASMMRRSEFDSDGAKFAINELKTAAAMSQITNQEVCAAKATIAAVLEEQKEIAERLAEAH